MLCAWLDREEKLRLEGPFLNPETPEADCRMIETLSERLPNLAVLELQLEGHMSLQAADSGMARVSCSQLATGLLNLEKRARLHFDRELIRSIVQSDAEGMQLLQIESGAGHDQTNRTHLPPTLRFLSSPCRSEHAQPCPPCDLTRTLLVDPCTYGL